MNSKHTNSPLPYDLSFPSEFKRLIREVHGYMTVSADDGTDRIGRRHAIKALKQILDSNLSLKEVKP